MSTLHEEQIRLPRRSHILEIDRTKEDLVFSISTFSIKEMIYVHIIQRWRMILFISFCFIFGISGDYTFYFKSFYTLFFVIGITFIGFMAVINIRSNINSISYIITTQRIISIDLYSAMNSIHPIFISVMRNEIYRFALFRFAESNVVLIFSKKENSDSPIIVSKEKWIKLPLLIIQSDSILVLKKSIEGDQFLQFAQKRAFQ